MDVTVTYLVKALVQIVEGTNAISVYLIQKEVHSKDTTYLIMLLWDKNFKITLIIKASMIKGKYSFMKNKEGLKCFLDVQSQKQIFSELKEQMAS